MRKQIKSILALLLVSAMMLSMASCANGKDKPSGSSSTEGTKTTSETAKKEADPYADPMEISVALWGIGDTVVEGEDQMRDDIYKKLNITIKPYPVTWDDYLEKIQVWAATQKLPDMTAVDEVYTDAFAKWSTQGVVREIPKDLTNFPNVKKILDTDEAKRRNEISLDDTDPKYFCIPRPNFLSEDEALLDSGIALRKDWMENVGVTKVPETLDEFIALLKLFKDGDPDKNGKDDTIALAGYSFGWMTQVFGSTCPAAINGFKWMFAEDGSLIPCFMTQDFLAAVKDMKKIYDAGLIDKDYIIYKGDDGRNKFFSGKAGAFAHGGPALGNMQVFMNGFKDTMPDKKIEEFITYLPWFKNQKGEIRYPAANMYWSETYIAGSVDDAKAVRCTALMDYILSDEGYELMGLGYEGKDYTKDASGKITLIDTKKSDGTVLSLKEKYPFSGMATLGYWTGFRSSQSPVYSEEVKKIRNDFLKFHLDQGAKPADLPDTNGLVLEETRDLDTASGNYIQIVNDLMTSKDIDAAFDKMVKEYTKSGFDKIIVEMNKVYKESGR